MAAFLYYGALQEDVFHYTALDGTKFKSAWFLQAVGAWYLRIELR
jgi:UDP-galactose transporter B1